MLRGWLVGIFVVGLTTFVLARTYVWPPDSDPEVDDVAALTGDELSDDEEIQSISFVSVQGFGTGRVTRPLADASEVEAPDEVSTHESSADDGDGRGDEILISLPGMEDVPGGASRETGNARAQAREHVKKAGASNDALEVAAHLSKAILTGGLTEDEETAAFRSLEGVNRQGLLSRSSDRGCYRVTVENGDSLWTICRRLEKEGADPIEYGLIRRFNGMRSNSVYEGQRLRVPSEPLKLVVDCSRFELYALVGDIIIERFRVGLGKIDTPTPRGTFSIKTRETEPSWFAPGVGEVKFGDPRNVLGTRWLGFASTDEMPNASSFGIHGTWEPESIGGRGSAGCVRMLNEDVEALFDLVPVGSKVIIKD